MSTYHIKLLRIGTDEVKHDEVFEGTAREAESRAVAIWNTKATEVGRFRCKMYGKGTRRALLTIG